MTDLYKRLQRFKQNTTHPSPTGVPPSEPVEPKPLPDKLAHIPGVSRARDLIGMAEKREQEKKQFLLTLDVQEKQNDAGYYGVREVFYPADALPYSPEDITGTELSLITRDAALSTLSAGDFLFIDTETTGLAGGTGTLPFLIGVGFFQEKGFLVRQFLMRDYDEEAPVLQELNQLLELYPALSTYNGKTFDVPILHSRFLLNRHPTRILEMPHADFLFPARRFWRDLLPDCTLLSVESHITGRTREDDIPGEQIPYVYFDFLRGLRMQRMRPVLHHNADDIVTLAQMACRLCRMAREPFKQNLHGVEIAALAKLHAANGEWNRACQYFEKALDQKINTENRLSIQKRLTLLYKRLNRFEDACSVWETMMQEHNDSFAFIELAKYYEHHQKSFEKALQLTEEAMTLLDSSSEYNDKNAFQQVKKQLQHRRTRLVRKVTNR